MAYTKKNNENIDKTKTTEKSVEETTKRAPGRPPKAEKTYTEPKADDMIPCRSVTKGELILVGKKTKEIYVWSDYGDVTEVEYQDLLALKASKSAFIFDVLFFIEDEFVEKLPKWKDVAQIYEGIYSDDVNQLIELDNETFKRIFDTLPSGLRKALVIEVSTRIDEGTFDSIQKIKLIDELCNTDLKSML